MKTSTKSTVIILSCVAAAAAGVTAIIAIGRLKARGTAHNGMTSRLRDVQEVLADCYSKINEIERQLPGHVESAAAFAAKTMRAQSPATNGRPVYDAG